MGQTEKDDVLLEARGLTLSWDEGERVVVRDISLSVERGEVVCLVGRSGCGKTTILHALSGLTRPVEGRVLLRGEDVTATPGRVSYMLQKDLLLPNKRIIDNVCLPLVIAGVPAGEARAQAAPLFERFGLAGCEQMWPSELSGGMRQRAAFLRTHLMGNEMLLLDEPFSALDALTRADMRRWYREMAAELQLGTLMITHDVDEAVGMAHRIYVLTGDPRAGVPSTIAAEVRVPRPAAGDVVADAAAGPVADAAAGTAAADFTLTPEFLSCKREVLAALGAR